MSLIELAVLRQEGNGASVSRRTLLPAVPITTIVFGTTLFALVGCIGPGLLISRLSVCIRVTTAVATIISYMRAAGSGLVRR